MNDLGIRLDVLQHFQNNPIRGQRQRMAVKNKVAGDVYERRTITDDILKPDFGENVQDQRGGRVITILDSGSVLGSVSKQKLEGVDHQVGPVDWLTANKSG